MSTHLVTCIECVNGATIAHAPAASFEKRLDRGCPGASAEREFRRRRLGREARTRTRHPRLGGLLLALRGTPQHESAFHRGGLGEQTVGRSLERRTARSPAKILHDRRMPRGYGNIDHLAIGPSGVYVIDAKAIKGKVRVVRPLLGRARLMVGTRNRTKLVDGLDRQVVTVRRTLAASGNGDVPVSGVLCFTEADLPVFGSSEIRGHRLHYGRALARKVKRKGSLTAERINALASELATSFPPA